MLETNNADECNAELWQCSVRGYCQLTYQPALLMEVGQAGLQLQSPPHRALFMSCNHQLLILLLLLLCSLTCFVLLLCQNLPTIGCGCPEAGDAMHTCFSMSNRTGWVYMADSSLIGPGRVEVRQAREPVHLLDVTINQAQEAQ